MQFDQVEYKLFLSARLNAPKNNEDKHKSKDELSLPFEATGWESKKGMDKIPERMKKKKPKEDKPKGDKPKKEGVFSALKRGKKK